MARETKEERQERLAAEAAKREAERTAFLVTLPKRLLDAQALALTLDVNVSVRSGIDNVTMHFQYGSYDDSHLEIRFSNRTIRNGPPVIDEVLSYTSEEHEIEWLEAKLQELKQYNKERNIRYNLAKSVFDRLTDNEKKAVREFAHTLS